MDLVFAVCVIKFRQPPRGIGPAKETHMKISIDTLPLWEAFRQPEPCPFCRLEHRMEELFVETYLGESVMEPDTRVEVNAKGFCPEHYRLLLQQKSSKLGLALMTHTHLKETIRAVEADMDAIGRALEGADSFMKRAAGSKDIGGMLAGACDRARGRAATCAVCERIELHMERYYETALSMWERDADFRKLYETSSGFCLPHWGRQLRASGGSLVSKKRIEFIGKLNEIEKRALSELERDLEGFTRKFDYRNADKPWGNSKDALPRAINMLEGQTIQPD